MVFAEGRRTMAEVVNEIAGDAPDETDLESIEEQAEAGPNKKKLLIIGILAFNLIAFIIGMGVLIALLMKSDPPPAPPAQAAAVAGAEAESPAEVAEAPEPKKRRKRQAGADAVNVALKAFVINLADADAPRYLKVDITLQVIDKEAEKEVEEYNAMVRDTVLAYLSGLSAEQTVGPLGKSDMRHAIKKRINDVLPSAPVERVFFTQFIVQWDQP